MFHNPAALLERYGPSACLGELGAVQIRPPTPNPAATVLDKAEPAAVWS